jgi:hypothetical protein
MGWLLVNIIVPATLPLLFLCLARLVDLRNDILLRANPLVAIRDGQLGWVSIGYAASGTYDLLEHVLDHKPIPEWAGVVLTMLILLTMLSAFLAMLGSLHPSRCLKVEQGLVACLRQYRLMLATLVLTTASAWFYSFVHFALLA